MKSLDDPTPDRHGSSRAGLSGAWKWNFTQFQQYHPPASVRIAT